VCERHVNLLVYSLSLHRHSYIGFILTFASSFHNNKQQSACEVDSSALVFESNFDPLEMLIFNLTVNHIWGHVLPKFQGTRTVTYPDDGYIKGKMSETLQVLPEFTLVLKEDAGLELNISKTDILPEAIAQCHTHQVIFDVAHGFINDTPQLTQLSGGISLDSFRPDVFVDIGVPIVTDTFVSQIVAKTYRGIIEDVEKDQKLFLRTRLRGGTPPKKRSSRASATLDTSARTNMVEESLSPARD
jgi:hypothetical protein